MSAWTVIAHTEVGSGGVASVTFSNIPQTYTDLVLMGSARLNGTNFGYPIAIRPNNSSANGTLRLLRGTGNGTSSYSLNVVLFTDNNIGDAATANTFGNTFCYIPNYTASASKSFSVDGVMENNATDGRQEIIAGLWSDNTAITSLVLIATNGQADLIKQYSSFTLYGITKGSSGGVTVS